MSESNHTPGPWTANREGKAHRFVGDGMWFAKVSWTVSEPRNDDDARLIAAAPNLLEAAQGMRRIIEEIDGAMNHGTWRDERGIRLKDTKEWVALYLALATAEGRS